MPLSGLASDVAAIGPQLWPPSVDQQAATTRLSRAAKDLHPAIGPGQDARLDRAELAPGIQRTDLLPGLPQVGRPLEMGAPAQMLGARRTKDDTARQRDRLVLDRSQNAAREPPRRRPGTAAVGGAADHAPPAARTRADLVEQQQRPRPGLMEHRIPARLRAARSDPGRAPPGRAETTALEVTCQPDPDLRVPLVRPAEPGCDQASRGFGDGRGVRRRERRLLEDELRPQADGPGR